MNKERIGAGGREGRSRRNVDEGGKRGEEGKRDILFVVEES